MAACYFRRGDDGAVRRLPGAQRRVSLNASWGLSESAAFSHWDISRIINFINIFFENNLNDRNSPYPLVNGYN